MHLTSNSFKKAAKRLATTHSVALNAAQESLAEAFGFANFDGALRALEPSAALAAPAQAVTSTWLGLTAPEVVAFMTAVALPRVHEDMWHERSAALLRIVLRDVFRKAAGKPVSARDIGGALHLDALEERCWNWEESGLPGPATDVQGYLLTLPGYRKELYGTQRDQTVEFHTHLQSPLAFAVARMEDMEAEGRLSPQELSSLGALALSAAKGNELAKDALRALVERCEFAS